MTRNRYHLEIQRRKGRVYGLIRSSFRNEGKVAHKTVGFLSGLGLEQLLMIQATLQGRTIRADDSQAPQVSESKEYGASFALLELARQLGLDRLLERQRSIERGLIRKHLAGQESLVLYDITSSYVEGQYSGSRLVLFGYNRDGKKGHAQVVFALVCNAQGCPVAVEVFPGNTRDGSTVKARIKQLRTRYGVKEVILVGDRGMITPKNFADLKDQQGLRLISALTHQEIQDLVERKVVQMGLFDEKHIAEVVDPSDPSIRYCLCRNPESARRETGTRDALMKRSAKALNRIASRRKRASPERLGSQVGRILLKTKMGKLIDWNVTDGRLEWQWKQARLNDEQAMDGCYIIRTTVQVGRMDKQKVVETCKQLALVEQAFRNIKTARLEVRPIHHKLDDRIRAHILLCTLAYHLQWHMQKRLQPLWDANGKESNRFWTIENVIERLKSIRRQTISIAGVPCRTVSQPDADQTQILNLLKIKL